MINWLGRILVSACVVLLVAGRAPAAVKAEAGRIREAVDFLSGLEHRLAGTRQGRAAGDFIIARLRAAGFDDSNLVVQQFDVTQLAVDQCWFEHNGRRVVLQPMRPNGLALPVTPAGGLEAETVYLGQGLDRDLAGKPIRGRIAVMEFDCRERWQEAFARGAVAVLFVGPSQSQDSPGAKWVYAHASQPRFFVEREQAEASGLLSGGPRIRIVSRMRFERLRARNIVAMIPGTESPEQVVAVACAYDTFGPMPFNVPGRRQAANVAGLIELAARFRKNPPSRTVAIVFFDNDAQDLSGQLAFHYARLSDPAGDGQGSLQRMIADRNTEQSRLRQRAQMLSDPYAVFAPQAEVSGDVRLAVREQLLAEIERVYDDQTSQLTQARLRMRGIRNGTQNRDDSPAAEARIDELSAHKDRLRSLRLAMMAGRLPTRADDPGACDLFDSLVADINVGIRARLSEIEQERSAFESWRELAGRLHGRTLLALAYLDLPADESTWTADVPSAAISLVNADFGSFSLVTNQSLTRWIRQCSEPGVARRWPSLRGVPARTAPDNSRWRVSAQATLVAELAGVGSTWPARGLPAEPGVASDAFARRLDEVGAFLDALIARPELTGVRIPPRVNSFVFTLPQWNDSGWYSGNSVRRYGGRAVDAELPVAGATVWIAPARDSAGNRMKVSDEHWGAKLATANQTGCFPLLVDGPASIRVEMTGVLLDGQGAIRSITQLHPGGSVGQPGNWGNPGLFAASADNRLAMFRDVRGVSVVHVRSLIAEAKLASVRVLNGLTDAPPNDLNVSLSGDVLSLYSSEDLSSWKLLQGSQVLLNNTPQHPTGDGYPLRAETIDAFEKAAGDLWRLNEDRLGSLRRHGVLQDSLEELHAKAEAYRQDAETSAESTGGAEGNASAATLASLGFSNRVYEPIRSVTNDLIQAVVILLLLAIPFAFSLERLMMGSPNVYKQIAGFAAIFATVFALLYVVHPAFQFAAFPVIVLLAFLIIIISGLVMFIMWGKFEYEIHRLQGLATASHQSTRNHRSTLAAAIAQGIASMRRRPLRTTLTAVTIMLLTFSVLFFGSFNAESGVRQVFVGAGPGTRQIEVRAGPDRADGFDPTTVRALRTLWRDEADSFVRQWGVSPDDTLLPGRLPDGDVIALAGWATIAPEELQLHPELREALAGDIEGFLQNGGIVLPASLYEQARMADKGAEARVDFLGRQWVVRGWFDAKKLGGIRTLEGASLLPPAVQAVQRTLKLQYPNDKEAVRQKLKEMELQDFPLLDGESVAMVSLPATADLGVSAHSLTFLPRNDRDAERIAGEIATMLDQRVTLSVGGQVWRVIYAARVSFAGMSQMIVPLVLGGLIIFSTMLSSVTDRRKEIFTLSALGLAPRHVATLFFAEATVYALIGGVGGYLFSQVFGKAIEAMASRGWVDAPAMNYSSMNAMVTILIIMATVLVSTIYPAMKASRSANPGIERRWRIPDPEGDEYRIRFPFTVSAYDLVGLISFIEEYFVSHRDKSVGSFAADDVRVERRGDDFVLTARVWLQPFDQGVSQTFELRTMASDIEGIDEIHISMKRLSGSPSIWQRSNAMFVGDIREQFIFWRTIPEEMTEHYHQATVERFALRDEEVPA